MVIDWYIVGTFRNANRCMFSSVAETLMSSIDNRESAHKRGYNRQWGKVRGVKLSRDPFCERCLAKGRTVPAQMVHHKDRNSSNNSFDNLESVCLSCHNDEHRDELFGNDKKGFVSKKGCGIDGKPEGWE